MTKKTEEDIVSLSIADLHNDIKEMLFAASLIEDNSIKKTIYNTVSGVPNDHRAYNNLAGYIKEKNINQAIDMLGKASKYNVNAAEVNENKGIIAALKVIMSSSIIAHQMLRTLTRYSSYQNWRLQFSYSQAKRQWL